MKRFCALLITAAIALSAAAAWRDGKVTEIAREQYGRGGKKAIVYSIESAGKTILAGEYSMEYHGFKPERFKVGEPIRFDLNERGGVLKVIDHAGKTRTFTILRRDQPRP